MAVLGIGRLGGKQHEAQDQPVPHDRPAGAEDLAIGIFPRQRGRHAVIAVFPGQRIADLAQRAGHALHV